MNQADFMNRAIALSKETMRAGMGGPFGAVVVKSGTIIAEGVNQVPFTNDPTAHAEIAAIRAACKALASFNLEACDLYASCEPCPMCLGAIYWARIARLYYGNRREDAVRIGFDDGHIYREIGRPIEKRVIPTTLLLAEEARAAFEAWLEMPNRVQY